MTSDDCVLGVDVGERRVGVARASLGARLPAPLATLDSRDGDTIDQLIEAARREGAVRFVVGLPRGLGGQETAQTAFARTYAQALARRSKITVDLQDEAATSLKASEELKGRGRPYQKSDIDALAATYILEDWLKLNGRPDVPAGHAISGGAS